MNTSPTDEEIKDVLRTSDGMTAKDIQKELNKLRGDNTRVDFFRHRLQQLKKYNEVTCRKGPSSTNIWEIVETKETE